MNAMRIFPGLIFVLVATAPLFYASAHDHWIRLVREGDFGRVEIGSGHAFPTSEFLLAKQLITETVAINPQGNTSQLQIEAREKVWTTLFGPLTPGVWSASFALKKPQEDEPLFRGRALLVVGDADDPARYAVGHGLELVPQAPLSKLKAGGTLPVSILVNGVPTEGRIAVMPEKGGVGFFSTGKDRPAVIKLTVGGAYLLSVSHKGKTFALVFSVPENREEAP
ncbi:MAG: DUF4198 domain-containing protein [Kiritimatiellae bacterium]|nr:DUF4198 domain-containing protein [Kiritimatiellia bacterium]